MPHSLVRDTRRLASRTFDLLVIGGGIYGLTVAADAAQRGLEVALVERHDVGSGTTFNHLRTIHGGLRYLQTLDLARARESVLERRTLARIAPWAIAPLPFVLPLSRSLTKGKAALSAGFLLDRLVSSDRNDDVPATHQLPAGRVIAPEDARASYPELSNTDMTAAAVWYDYVTVDADRLTLAWALAAAEAGATIANYAQANALLAHAGHVVGALVTDRVTGTTIEVRARHVVNATGGAIDRLLAPFGAATGLPLLRAVNVVTNRPAPSAALGGRSASGRNLFLVPWQGRAVFGTWESPSTCEPDDTAIGAAALQAFLDELNQAFAWARLTAESVTLIHRGVVPARIRHGQPPTLEGHELVYEHAAEGLGGVISVAGTKYTTARTVAARIVDRIAQWHGGPLRPCRTAEVPLPHVTVSGDALLAHAAAHEMVVTLGDAVLRRTPLAAVGDPGDGALAHAASIVGRVLGWDDVRTAFEIQATREALRAYGTLNASNT